MVRKCIFFTVTDSNEESFSYAIITRGKRIRLMLSFIYVGGVISMIQIVRVTKGDERQQRSIFCKTFLSMRRIGYNFNHSILMCPLLFFPEAVI